jgi:uncharacterized membrane protein
VSTFQIALLLHISAAIAFFSGLVLAAATTGFAARRDHLREIAVLLSLARVGALMVLTGGIATLALGFWLVELTEREPNEAWLSASVALLLAAFVLGAIGGRPLKRARILSASASADTSPAEISELLRMPVARAANAIAGLASVAVLVLMVWRPGG